MSINFYYGLNASFRTRKLEAIRKESIKKGLKVASNLLPDYKIVFKEDEQSNELLKGTKFMDMKIKASYCTEPILNWLAFKVTDAITASANVLILDGLETMFTPSQLCYVFEAIRKVQSRFDEIDIATNSYTPIEMFRITDEDGFSHPYGNYYLCNKG